MIAGTSFVLCDARQVRGQLLQRIARTQSPLQVLEAAVEAEENEHAVSLCCDDGLVIMTLTTSADGTITAMVLMAASFGIGGAFKRRETEMMAIARDAGASRLAFKTDRKGWGRLLGPEWRLDDETFSRSL